MQLCRDCDCCQDHCCCSMFGRYFTEEGECGDCTEEAEEDWGEPNPNRNVKERPKQ